ncbi:hypothetical protein HNV10_08365 [Winogradskyella litoriviva]|uniref:Serine kinase n=1 Tax=Winogradskyella litoriviva TaxID=1220182 RepID=A0ABX2E4N5_9FLAO|nr:hypothetical protein [Winogradskyella litoriviva]NRD23252.1 hypothetical protein [Winogradskyella litoriviva]
MNNSLSPTYQKKIGDMWLLWFAVSNSYSIVDNEFKVILDSYLTAETKKSFDLFITKKYPFQNASVITDSIEDYLTRSNISISKDETEKVQLDTCYKNITKLYAINKKIIKVNYDSELVLKTIHPSIAYTSIITNDSVDTTFDIYLKNDILYLFQENLLITSAPKLEYHKIQGKFIMQLLCTIHNKIESDWIGSFHGSTITDGNSSILMVGESGKGKSTLCALLTANGFNLLADDVSPMLSKDKAIYYNPAAISIKEGAFSILENVIDDFKDLPPILFNKQKGTLKYLPCIKPEQSHYPCNAVILVNYKENSNTILTEVSVKRMLETIIPDSWLSPKPYHAKQFLEWLSHIKVYELTYSDIKDVTKKVSYLFESLSK